MYELMCKIRKVEKVLADKLDREPSRAEVAAAVGISEAKVHGVFKAYRTPTSIDAPLKGDDETRTVGDFIEDDKQVSTAWCRVPQLHMCVHVGGETLCRV